MEKYNTKQTRNILAIVLGLAGLVVYTTTPGGMFWPDFFVKFSFIALMALVIHSNRMSK